MSTVDITATTSRLFSVITSHCNIFNRLSDNYKHTINHFNHFNYFNYFNYFIAIK